MRKTVVFVLVLSLLLLTLLSTAVNAFSAESVNLQKIERKYKILNELGLLTDDFELDEGLSEEATRANVVTGAICLLGLHQEGEEPETAFDDVDFFASYAKDIKTARDMNLISGVSKTEFAPDESITLRDAVKVFVLALNYKAKSEAYGGYPYGYLRVGTELGLLDDISADAEGTITKADLLNIIYNASQANYAKEDIFVNSEISYRIQKNYTILTSRRIYKDIGVVTRAGGTDFYDDNDYPSDSIKINGTVYKSKIGDMESLLGFETEVYYNDDKEIIAAAETENNTVMTLDDESIIKIDGGYLHYYADGNGREKKVAFSEQCNIVYNGRTDAYFNDSSFTKIYGTVKLINNNSDSYYDAVLITDYKNYTVKQKNDTNRIIYDDGKKIDLSTDDGKTVKIFKNGKEVQFSDIRKDDLLSVLISRDNLKVTVYISDLYVTGKIEEISEDFVAVNRKKYEISNSFKEKLKLGDEGKFSIDYLGKIADYNTGNESLMYGYLIAGKKSENIGNDVLLKILTQNNEVSIFKVAKKVTINDTVKVDGENLLGALPHKDSENLKSGVIRFLCNSDNEIKKLYNAECSDKDILSLDYECEKTASAPDPLTGRISYKYATVPFRTYNMIFSDETPTVNFAVAPDAVVFNVPKSEEAENANDDDYTSADVSVFKNENSYSVDAYNFGDVAVSEVVVNYTEIGAGLPITEYSPYGMVSSVWVVTADDGSSRSKISLLQGGKTQDFITYDDNLENTANLKIGTLIQYELNGKGEIASWKVLLDPFADNNPSSINQKAYASRAGIYGRVYSKDSVYLRICVTKNGNEYDFNDFASMRLINAGKGNFHIFDKSADKAYIASGIDDVLGYLEAGEEASTVYVRVAGNDARDTFVFYE